MKKIIAILLSVLMLCSMMTVLATASSSLVYKSVYGTATIDGDKDSAYDTALALPLIQTGYNSGDGKVLDEPNGTVYILNDDKNVYILFEMYDDNLDDTNANTYKQDSVELFYMKDNAMVQLRYVFNGVVSDETLDNGHAIKLTDKGYNVEVAMPITDVLDNKIDMCVQHNDCSNGDRDYTVYVEGNSDGDDAWKRDTRDSEYDCWWKLELAGSFEDEVEEPVEEPVEEKPITLEDIDAETLAMIQNDDAYSARVFLQDTVKYGYTNAGIFHGKFGEVLEMNDTDLVMTFRLTAEETADYTKKPKFGIQIAEKFLKLPEGSVRDTVGESGTFTFTWTDITIKAEGYDDVVIPGQTKEFDWTIVDKGSYTSGNMHQIDFVKPVMEQLGLDLETFCTEYLPKVSDVSTTVTLTEYNGITVELLNGEAAEEPTDTPDEPSETPDEPSETPDEPVETPDEPEVPAGPVEVDDATLEMLTNNQAWTAMVFMQDTVNWGWTNAGVVQAKFGEVADYNASELAMTFIAGAEETKDYTKTVKFGIQIAEKFLKLPENSEKDTVGESGTFTFTWTDITLKADGYADVVIPGETRSFNWTIVDKGSYTSGNTHQIDFTKPIMEQLGLDIAGLCDYMKNLTDVTTTIALTEYNGITVERIEKINAEKQAVIDEFLKGLDPYKAIVEEALESAKAANNEDLEALKTELEGYEATAKAALADAEAYVNGDANGAYEIALLASSCDEIGDLIEDVEEELEKIAKEEADRIAAEEAAKIAAAEKAAATKRTVTICIIVAAVVAVAVVVVIIIAKSKKK